MSLPASLVPPDEGEVFVFPNLFTITARLTSSQTGGVFELYRLDIGIAAVDYHIHRLMDETLTVLSGSVEFTVDGLKRTQTAGSVTFIPRGMHHGFRNLGPAPAQLMILFTPPYNQDVYFRGVAKALAAPVVDSAQVAMLQKQYDQELISPNLVTA